MIARLRIAVVGGGTAGSASALLLAPAGHTVTVFERVPNPGPVGAGIMMQPSGPLVLEHRGLARNVLARGARGRLRRCDGAPLRLDGDPDASEVTAVPTAGAVTARHLAERVQDPLMPLPLFTVDAFADRAFSGNPAAVCLLPAAAEAAWMQLVAREMSLSETAFVAPRADGDFDLRWFTPNVEVDLCGHATLASAHVLWEAGRLDVNRAARFHTRSGVLTATRERGLVALDLPAHPAEEAPLPGGVAEAIGARIVWCGRSRFDVLLELADEGAVRALTPDLAALAKLEGRGFIVTARAGRDHDFVSRFFAPRVGVPEDPVTGSAHCVLGPFWAARLGRRDLVGFQASARGGVVHVSVNADRVTLKGRGVTVTRGELLATSGEV